MIQVLIVDDEIHCAEGVKCAIDWSLIGVDQVLTAYSMQQAQQIFIEQEIHILICDVEMPKGSGFDLLEWIRLGSFSPVVIMLTSYATFEYAKQAINYGCLDYLLKPVSSELLMDKARRAVEAVMAERHKHMNNQLAEYWKDNQKRREEHFWREVIEGQTVDPQTISLRAEQAHVTLNDHDLYLPILYKVSSSETHLGWTDIGKALREYLLQQALPRTSSMTILGGVSSMTTIITTSEDLPAVYQQCFRQIQLITARCSKELRLRLAVYIGAFDAASEVAAQYDYLMLMDRDNVDQTPGIYEISRQPQILKDVEGVIKQVKRYVRQHLGEELSRGQIAANVGMSPDYVSRLFRQETGIQLSEYITEVRMEEARQLLGTTALPVGEVAYKVGFLNVAYFSRVFRIRNGETPAHYRTQFKNN